jgi:hypothetical protein
MRRPTVLGILLQLVFLDSPSSLFDFWPNAI